MNDCHASLPGPTIRIERASGSDHRKVNTRISRSPLASLVRTEGRDVVLYVRDDTRDSEKMRKWETVAGAGAGGGALNGK
jgi:hypothetical protein